MRVSPVKLANNLIHIVNVFGHTPEEKQNLPANHNSKCQV